MSVKNQQTAAVTGKPTLEGGLTLSVKRVFSKRWVKTLRAKWGMPASLVDYVHPCYIKKQHTLVYARDLAFSNPDLFQDLQNYAQQQGFQLLADRRRQDIEIANDRRRKWLPVFTLSLGLSVAVHAEHNEQGAIENTLALFDAPLTMAVENPAASISDKYNREYDFDPSEILVEPLTESTAEVITEICWL